MAVFLNKLIKFVFIAVISLILITCNDEPEEVKPSPNSNRPELPLPPQTHPTTQPIEEDDTLVVLVGGWLGNQLGELGDYITSTNQNVEVWWMGDTNAYKADIVSFVVTHPKKKIVLIGHSFGGDAIIAAAERLPHVDLLVLLDPVARDWGDLIMPKNIGKYLYFVRDKSYGQPPTANIPGAERIVIKKDHNKLCHDPQVMVTIILEIRNIP